MEAKTLRIPVLLSIALAPAWAQVLPTLPACEQSLAQQLAVPGLNPAWVSLHPLSSSVIPSMGFATPDMASAIDATVGNFMNMNNLPGGAVAITYKNHLIFAKSYGYVDLDNALFMEPDSRMRVASVSKAITGMGIMKLVHDGQLSLDDQPFPFSGVGSVLGGAYNTALSPPSGPTVDEMLHHAGGWDRDTGPDLMGYDTLHTVEGLIPGSSGPPDCTTLMSYVESQPLQFRPGTKVDYSNVGFCALSEVIHETSGSSYIDYMTTNVLSPLGMIDTTLGSTQQSKQQDREAVYYDTTDPPQPSLFAPYATVPPPYSGIGALEAQQGGGAYVSTAIDLAHFTGAIASGNLPNFPSAPAYPGWPQMYYTLSTRIPAYDGPADGAGWDYVPSDVVAVPLLPYDNYNFIKDGGYQGTVSSVVATADGYGFAAVFNGGDNTAPGPEGQIFWPGCNTPAPEPAAKNGDCALQAAYNHAAKQAWNMDLTPQYSQAYSAWMDAADFATYLAAEKSSGSYPWRLEGRTVTSGSSQVYQYRGRFAPPAASVQTAGALSPAPPQFVYGQSCSTVLSAIQSAGASTPLASLQRFYDTGSKSYVYQAVWSGNLPTHFTVSAPASATAGTAFNFTVTALDSSGNTAAGYSGPVDFSSSDTAAVLPAGSMLANGTGTFSATLKTGGSKTITAADSGNALTGTSAAIAVTVPPTPVSVTPVGGSAASGTFTFVFTDPRGYLDLNVVDILVNNFLDGRHACYLAYVVGSKTLVLVDDGGDAGGPYAGSVALGNSAAIQNSQCTVTLVSAVGSGNKLTLMLTIAWTAGFAGDKIVQVAAGDAEGNNSGWYPLGVWRAPGGTQTTTTAVVGMTPNQGSGLGPTLFTFNFSDTKGVADLGVEDILINSSLDGRHACYIAYSQPFNTLYLENDNGDGLLPGQSMAASGSVSNSQCTVSWGGGAVTAGGNNLSLTLNITFTAAFGGDRIVYLAARDVNEANNTDWHAMGTWTPQ
ncbi:exported hypothetical protein [Candidatus Sulfopaludibacter sp. SbA4]|nr:exported hypothetical protein [Candidatus Sulfopaludibacter sp. SbA4]